MPNTFVYGFLLSSLTYHGKLGRGDSQQHPARIGIRIDRSRPQEKGVPIIPLSHGLRFLFLACMQAEREKVMVRHGHQLRQSPITGCPSTLRVSRQYAPRP